MLGMMQGAGGSAALPPAGPPPNLHMPPGHAHHHHGAAGFADMQQQQHHQKVSHKGIDWKGQAGKSTTRGDVEMTVSALGAFRDVDHHLRSP